MSRVVVAEDDAHIRRVICLWLRRQGHEVFEASNGRVALDMVLEHEPRILVTDVNMPLMDGIELLKELTERDCSPHGIVVLTNRWDHREIGEQLAGPGMHVMPKPFSPTRLAELIDQLGSEAPEEAST
ncbi:MAG: response regulator [Phycisphaerae bacterium]|nr:response regulator [Phycisphaerae bacterium]